MTTSDSHTPTSMRFEIQEVLSGMLATVERQTFTDDPVPLTAMFEGLSERFTLFARFQANADPQAVGDALTTLEQRHYLEHGDGEYTLTAEGRAHCVSSKRTLFNQSDREQLEAAALVFDTL